MLYETASDYRPEHVLLVGVAIGAPGEGGAERSLAELARLVETSGGVEAGRRLFYVRSPLAATLLSRGQVEEVHGLIESVNADAAAVDVELSPAQQRNLEKAWGIRVLTRSEVILDIFAQHAHTAEGRLQVELAQLRYRMPRLTGRGVQLSRLGGGIGTRGPGEQKLEVDRRRIQDRIRKLETGIDRVQRSRQTQRARRRKSGLPVVALVGYTNAGKSTLLNRIAGTEAFVADQLFATLDPAARVGRLPSGADAAFVDTVGFIHRLPHTLVAAFRATLEETLYADLVVHVADASSPAPGVEFAATEAILEEIGALDKPRLLVWNKRDAALGESAPERAGLSEDLPSVEVSALTGEGLVGVLRRIEDMLSALAPPMEILLPYDRARLLDRIHRESKVLRVDYENTGVRVRLRPPAPLRETLGEFAVPLRNA